uniref:Transcriptional repressor rco-1 n=1 Tax=Ganoderma boninense TaxID=34458 RepID=A0A5K1JXT7_9APHY|nr:Transcriptional repressor rco-1 [Ganoderma boninense]
MPRLYLARLYIMTANRSRSPEYVTYARIAKNRSGTTCLDFRSPAPQSHVHSAVPTMVRMLGDIYPDPALVSFAAAARVLNTPTVKRNGPFSVGSSTNSGPIPFHPTASAAQSHTDNARAGTPSVPVRRFKSIRSGPAAVGAASMRAITPSVAPAVVANSSIPLSVGGASSPAPREEHPMHVAGVSATETSDPSVLKLDDVDPQTYKRETKLCQLTEEEKTAMRSRRGKASQVERAVTAWFESTAALPLASPPDLSTHDEIQLGDLYWHESHLGVQLWLWTESEDNTPVWKPVHLGLSRESDGRRLFLNPSGKPSWMTNNWYHKQKAVPRNVFILRNEQ